MTGTTRRPEVAAISAAAALHIFRRQRIERDICAGLGQHLGDSLADAASGPCDEDDFPRDIEFGRHHDMFSCLTLLAVIERGVGGMRAPRSGRRCGGDCFVAALLAMTGRRYGSRHDRAGLVLTVTGPVWFSQ